VVTVPLWVADLSNRGGRAGLCILGVPLQSRRSVQGTLVLSATNVTAGFPLLTLAGSVFTVEPFDE